MAPNEPEDLKFEGALQEATRRFVAARHSPTDANDRRALAEWLAADRANASAFAEIEMLWRDLGPAAEQLARERDSRNAAPAPGPILHRHPLIAAAAACLMLLCIAAALWWEWSLVTHASAGRGSEDRAIQTTIPTNRSGIAAR